MPRRNLIFCSLSIVQRAHIFHSHIFISHILCVRGGGRKFLLFLFSFSCIKLVENYPSSSSCWYRRGSLFGQSELSFWLIFKRIAKKKYWNFHLTRVCAICIHFSSFQFWCSLMFMFHVEVSHLFFGLEEKYIISHCNNINHHIDLWSEIKLKKNLSAFTILCLFMMISDFT